MRLYAQTTSERASKGQGGNDKVLIELTIDPIERKMIGRLSMTCEKLDKDTDLYSVYYYPINEECVGQKINSGRVLLYQEEITKGKQQKAS